jgi:hypothetical protein
LGVDLIRGAHESLPEALVELDLADVSLDESLEGPEAADDEPLSLPLAFESDETLVFSDELEDSLLSAFFRDSEG